MNQRIKELAEQATTYIEPTSNSGEGWIFDKEKFAELVIDECCLKLLDMDQKVNGNHNYYKHAAIEIKRSFK
jgi:hypothetical protein